MKIAFDLDGVVMNTHEVIFELLEADYNYDRNNQKEYAINIPGVENSSEIIKNILLENTKHIRPYKNANFWIKQIYYKLKKPFIFITARDKELKEVTDEWVKKWIYAPHSIIYTTNSMKKLIIEKLGITHFVEDRFRNALEISEICKVYLVNQPWNTGRIPFFNVKRIPHLGWVLKDVEKGGFYIGYNGTY